MRRHCFRLCLGFALVLVVAGCQRGETARQVVERYRPRIDALRERLKAIHAKLPATAAPLEAKLDPPPLYAPRTPDGNTDFLAVEHVLDPYGKPAFDLILSDSLSNCLFWTGPRGPSDPDKVVGKQFAQAFEHSLALRYVVLLRSSGGQVKVGEQGYSGGSAGVEAFVVDLSKDAVVAVAWASGTPDSQVSFQYRANEDKNERAAAAVHSSAWEHMRADLAPKLAAATGGKFDFK